MHEGTAHKHCIFTSRGVRLALVKSNELGISGANGVWQLLNLSRHPCQHKHPLLAKYTILMGCTSVIPQFEHNLDFTFNHCAWELQLFIARSQTNKLSIIIYYSIQMFAYYAVFSQRMVKVCRSWGFFRYRCGNYAKILVCFLDGEGNYRGGGGFLVVVCGFWGIGGIWVVVVEVDILQKVIFGRCWVGWIMVLGVGWNVG